jgi:hypothetical protein
VAVPVNPDMHWAIPFWSTVTPGFMFPTHMPLFDPTHHDTSLLARGMGDGGLLKAPVAVNKTWPPEKFWASATAGFNITDCNWRLLPHPISPIARIGSTRRRRQGLKRFIEPLFTDSYSEMDDAGCIVGCFSHF